MWRGTRLGWLPDLPDPKKPKFEMLGVGFGPPPTATLTHLTAPIPDQSVTNSCVGQSVRQAFYIEEKRLHGTASPASALGVYFNARAVDGVEHLDVGCRIASALSALVTHGVPREAQWPFELVRVNQRPSALTYKTAYTLRGKHHYYSIDGSGDERLDQIKRAIASGHGVVFGTPVSGDIVDDTNGPLVVDKPKGDIRGGHSMCVVGYEPGRFLVANSYGSYYRQQGFVWLTDEYMAWEQTHSLWVLAL